MADDTEEPNSLARERALSMGGGLVDPPEEELMVVEPPSPDAVLLGTELSLPIVFRCEFLNCAPILRAWVCRRGTRRAVTQSDNAVFLVPCSTLCCVCWSLSRRRGSLTAAKPYGSSREETVNNEQ